MLNIGILLQLVVGVILWIIINYSTYYFTEKSKIPEWLYYQPFICRKCCFFWTSFSIFISIGFISEFKLVYLFVTGILLTFLNTAALYVDEKNKFIED